jgi:hypothetical protein
MSVILNITMCIKITLKVRINSRILREKYKWKGLQMDGSNEDHNINLKNDSWAL